MKRYLGDGVYIEWNEGLDQWILTTEDGIKATNTIYLEPAVMTSLLEAVQTRRC